MTITALTLTNPGAEAGSMSGWTVSGGFNVASITSVGSIAPHSGSRFFTMGTSSGTVTISQTIDVSAFATAIDGNTGGAKVSAFQNSDGDSSDVASLFITCLANDGTTVLYTEKTTASHPTVWTAKSVIIVVPVGTRSIKIGSTLSGTDFTGPHSYWDDFALEISDAATTDYPTDARVFQAALYGLVSQPAAQLKASQAPVLVTGAAEESNGLFLMKTHQVVAYALVKGMADRNDLRAWPFVQDDHIFYVLQLGALGTIVLDMLSQQWARWMSSGFAYWRGNDGTDWEGYNVCCDTESGKIWKIDAQGRLDEGTTAITSTITGQATVRFRRAVPCYMAELAVSEALPATTGTGIQLRISDDAAASFSDQGTVAGEALGDSTVFRWYGLGLMQSPGRVFQIVDSGYARRIDGLDIEVGGNG